MMQNNNVRNMNRNGRNNNNRRNNNNYNVNGGKKTVNSMNTRNDNAKNNNNAKRVSANRVTVNEILMRRKNKVTIPARNPVSDATKEVNSVIVAFLKNVQELGYTFDKELFQNLMTYPKIEVIRICNDMMAKLKRIVGADKTYTPMYPNFPAQVADMDAAELFINAIIHYWSFGVILPDYKKDYRMPLFDDVDLTVLSVGTDEDVLDIFKNLVSSKTSLSEQDKKEIKSIIGEYPQRFYNYLPDEIPLKENVAFLVKSILDISPIKNANAIQKYFKTATDVLRFVVALSDGDISLATPTKFKSMRRCERRMVMDLLAGCGDILEDMFRYQYEWIRVGEIVHPFEFKVKKYSNVYAAFNTLRNEKKPLFIPGKVQDAINNNNMREAAILLKSRPGDFARNLDKLVRDAENKNYVVNCFKAVANKVSVPVLLQVRQHFMDRNKNIPVRVFFPKGSMAKAKSIPNNLPEIDSKICGYIVQICNNAIIEQFKSKDYMGNVYVDNELSNYIVPFSQRSASSGGKNLVRGSHVGLNSSAKAVRSFIWWTNTDNDKSNDYWDMNGRVDLDLSAAIYDENWNYMEHVSYTNLRSHTYRSYHSGDITNGGPIDGDGVAEFIDIDIDSVAKRGRYVAFQVYSYTRQKFSELPNVRFGWMEREDVNSGEIFEPSTVDMSINVSSDSITVIPVIFDCVAKEYIWCDMALSLLQSRSIYGNNVESNIKGVTAVCYAMTHLSKPNLYDLIGLNVMARGNIVADRNEADIIFSNDTTPPVETVEVVDADTGEKNVVEREKQNYQIVTAYDTDYVMAQLF